MFLGNLSKIPIYRYGHALPWQLRGNFHTSAFCFSEEPAGVEKEEEEYHTIIKNTERAKGDVCCSAPKNTELAKGDVCNSAPKNTEQTKGDVCNSAPKNTERAKGGL